MEREEKLPEHSHSAEEMTPEAIEVLRGRFLQSLSEHHLFAGLKPDQVGKLFGSLMVEDFKDEEIVCRCPAQIAHHDAFLVLSGKVAIKLRTGSVEHVLDLAGFGTIFNIEGLLELTRQDIGARALGAVELMMIDVEKLLKYFSQESEAGYLIMRNLARLSVEQHRKYLERYVQ